MINQIREYAKKNRIGFKQHSVIRMLERNIKAQDIKNILKHGELVEEYPKDYPFPSCLLLGSTKQNQPLHIVVAIDEEKNYLWIITVYVPDINKWESNFKNRKEL